MRISIDKPLDDEFEITTLGPGASSGESIVIHLISDEWIIIDSCMSGDEILPLTYLREIDVDYEKVTKVICTHWHTDHIKGMPEILRKCRNAQLYMAPVGPFKGYLNLVLKIATKDPFRSTVWTIFDNCLSSLEEINHRRPKFISHNERFAHSEDFDLFAIGPSDELIQRFHKTLFLIDPNNVSEDDATELEGNICSMAFSLRFYNQKILVGGDMEVGRIRQDKYNAQLCTNECPEHEECGWCEAIMDGNIFAAETPYHFVNIPHHSSSSAFCPKMWKEGMVEGGPISTTTCFRCASGESLPTREMLEIYRTLSSRLYTTNGVVNEISKSEVREFEGVEGIEVVEEIIDNEGVIISRWRTQEEGWKVYCFGTARLVDEAFIADYHKP